MEYRWRTNVANYNYPVGVLIGSEPVRLDATNNWQVMGKGFTPRDVSIETDKYLVELDWIK